jgi:hypothetical protein
MLRSNYNEKKYNRADPDPDFILAQPQTELKSTLFTTGPYMDMLFDGMFVPTEDADGTVVWANPAGTCLRSHYLHLLI